MTYWKWSTSAAANANADSTINWAEGQAPSTINDSARAMMASSAKHRNDVSNAGSSAGTAGAYTLSSEQVLTAFTDKFQISFVAHISNDAGASINIDSLGAKPLATNSGSAIGAGVLTQGGLYTISYDSSEDEWHLHGIRSDLSPFPVGFLGDFMGTTTPAGWLLANGQAVSRTTYAELFAELGITHGSGDGSNTFNLPDCRGRFTAGSDTMGTTAANRLTSATMSGTGQDLGETGGAETHSLTADELASHTHSGSSLTASSAGSHTHSGSTGNANADHTHQGTWVQSIGSIQVPFGSGQNAAANPTQGVFSTGGQAGGSSHQHSFTTGGAGTHTHPVSGNTGSTGSGDAHPNIPPTILANKIIKF